MRFIYVFTVLILLSLSAMAQTFIGFGPRIGTTSASSGPAGSQTQAGAEVRGALNVPLGLVEMEVGGSMGFFNQLRFFDNGSGGVFEAEPVGRMYISVNDRWSIYFEGGGNMQRFNDITVFNPSAGFGARNVKRDEAGNTQRIIRFGYRCYFDDTVNSALAPQVWRGFQFNTDVYKKFSPNSPLGFIAGIKIDRQSNSILGGARTQPSVYAALTIGGK